MTDLDRIKANLKWIEANPGKGPLYWIQDVLTEARSHGLMMPPGKNVPSIQTVIAEARILARQERDGIYD